MTTNCRKMGRALVWVLVVFGAVTLAGCQIAPRAGIPVVPVPVSNTNYFDYRIESRAPDTVNPYQETWLYQGFGAERQLCADMYSALGGATGWKRDVSHGIDFSSNPAVAGCQPAGDTWTFFLSRTDPASGVDRWGSFTAYPSANGPLGNLTVVK